MTDLNTSSNASNFGEFISSGVDPRTGTYSASVYLGKFIGHKSSGPTFNLSLHFTPGSTIDVGFGRGWSLPTGFYDKKTKPDGKLALPDGQSFKLYYDFGTEKYSIPYRKLLDIDISEKHEELIVAKKDATQFVYDIDKGYLKRIINPQGLAITFEFDIYNSKPMLNKITDHLGQETTFEYFENKDKVTVEHKFDNVVHQRFIIDKKRNTFDSNYCLSNVTQYDNNDNELNSFDVEYELDRYSETDLITQVTYPSGMIEEIVYQDFELNDLDEYPVKIIKQVSKFKRTNLGSNQPDSITDYTYSNNNYLGNGSGMRYETGQDTLFYVTADYVYESTEIINGTKSIIRQYNKYHLLEFVQYLDNGNLYREEDYEYFADLDQGIEEQPAKYSLLQSQTTTHYYNGEKRDFTLEYEYDDYANPVRETRADGSRVERTFYSPEGEAGACPPDPNGMVSVVKTETFVPATGDPERTTTMTYTSLARLDDPNQNFIVLESQTDDNQSIEMEYCQDDSDIYSYGRVASQKQSIGGYLNTTKYQYDFLPEGLRTTTSVLSHDQLEISESEKIDYFFGLPIEYVDADENISRFVYDDLGRLTQEVIAPDTGYEAKTSYTYQVEKDNNVTTETDSSGNIVFTHLNNAGKTIRVEIQGRDDKENKTIQEFNYDEFGLMVSQTDTDWVEDESLTLTTEYEYDINGEVKKVTHSDGRIEQIEQNPISLTTVYEQQGLLSETTVYNISGFVLSKETKDSDEKSIAKTDYQYDGYGNLLCITDIEGITTEYRYDNFDRLIETVRNIDQQEVSESLSYPDFISEGIPNTVSINQVEQGRRAFDGLLRLNSATVNDGTTSYNYQGTSALPNKITTANGDVFDITNNIHLQAPESISCSADARLNCTYQYDPVTGLSTADVNEDCQRSVIYDSFGRVVTESVELADDKQRQSIFRYSLLGKLLEKTDFFGNTTLYDYDSLGRLQTITEAVSGTQTTTTIAYDQFSRPYKYTTERESDIAEIELGFNDAGLETSRVARFNGTEEFSIAQKLNIRQLLETRTFNDAQGQTVETFTYDDFARLDSYSCTGINAPSDEYGNILTGQSFEYDMYGNVKKVTSNFDSSSNNITTFSYSPSNPQRLESLTNTHDDYPGSVTFEYDAAGNLLNDEQGREYTYNALNQLSSVAPNGEPQITQYSYDAAGRVVAQTVEENLLYLFYLGDRLSNELCNDGYSVSQSIAPGLVARTVKVEEDSLHQFILGNSQGSVLETLSTNAAMSRDKETRRYTPYGEDPLMSGTARKNTAEVANSQNILYANPFGFNGERQDPATKMYHLGNGYRAYNPTLKRFCAYDSVSPFGAGGINGYAYCAGDPLNRRDPSGHGFIALIVGAIVGAVVGAGLAAAAEGIQTAINPDHQFDWKQVGIGAALGFISGGFGAAAQGAKTSAQVGLAIADTAVSSAADFGLNVATGTPVQQAGISAGIGAVIGLGAFGVGKGIGKLGTQSSKSHVSFGGNMKSLDSQFKGMYTFEDTYKGGRRLNVAAHGEKINGVGQLVIDSPMSPTGFRNMDANELGNVLSSQFNLSSYQYLRTIVCFSGNGGVNSLGSQLKQITGLPVKSYVGPVSGNFDASKTSDLVHEAAINKNVHAGLQASFASKHQMRVDKTNPYSIFSKDYWTFQYSPVHFR